MQASEKALISCGLKDNSKVLILGSSPSATSRLAEQETASLEAESRSQHLKRVKAAASAIAKRESR